jgi:amidohydrolase
MTVETPADPAIPMPQSEMLAPQPVFETIDDVIESVMPRLVEIRRHLHQFPELSGEEIETTRFIAEKLREFGIDHEYEPGQCGLVAEVGGGKPSVGLRGDIDAIRVYEKNDIPFKSCVPGVMHACGHDVHTTMLLGAMVALKEVADVDTSVRGVFQLAEENGSGAREMIRRGAIDGLKGIFAFHVDPSRPVGKIGSRPGINSAYCDEIIIDIIGRGGHGARPQETIDPIAAAVNLIQMIYAQVPRNIDSRDSLVVTFGKIVGANQLNVIPDQIRLEGTLRSLDATSRGIAIEKITAISNAIAMATGATINIEFSVSIPSVVNDPILTELAERVVRQDLGDDAIEQVPEPSMGGEDFSVYQQQIPGVMLRLGCVSDQVPATHLHSPTFNVDERALMIGARVLAKCALSFIANHKR